MKIELKYFPQHTEYSCGPACLKMIFHHLGLDYSEKKLIKLCHTIEKTGTSHEHLVNEVKKEGFVYLEHHKGTIKQLIAYVENGYLPLVNYIEPISKESHYAIVCGYDAKKEEFIFADPSNGYDFSLHYENFRKHWYNEWHTSKGWFLIIGREQINDI
jgi:ABC-type bacteriocin/lantibiotic exporter with double-glycine peptidase domain